jgi:hypothetical protein
VHDLVPALAGLGVGSFDVVDPDRCDGVLRSARVAREELDARTGVRAEKRVTHSMLMLSTFIPRYSA